MKIIRGFLAEISAVFATDQFSGGWLEGESDCYLFGQPGQKCILYAIQQEMAFMPFRMLLMSLY